MTIAQTAPTETAVFHQFFQACVGKWQTERTYHYLYPSPGEVERSRTEFAVQPVDADRKRQVLQDNDYAPIADLDALPGFELGFHTVSETGEEVSQELRMLFVIQRCEGGLLYGDYLRDRAYTEARPIVSDFCFDPSTRELLMTTRYSKSVSVDSITLVNPALRIRKILNYLRPPEGEPLKDVALVGFGVEQKLG
jgi:hypothetical protein